MAAERGGQRQTKWERGGGDVSEAITSVARDLRAIAEDLRPPALSRFGLSAALSAHAGRFRERHPGVSVALKLHEDEGPGGSVLSESSRVALFRVAQEAMVNAVQHGGAQNIAVELCFEPSASAPERVRLEVRDDGAGLPSPSVSEPEALTEGGHFGVAGMHERAALLGGRFSLRPRGVGGDVPTGAPSRPGLTAEFVVPWSAVARDRL